MQTYRQFGVAAMTLSDVVDDFCLAQGNMKADRIAAQLRHGRWAWKQLFKTTLWEIRKAVIEVDCAAGTFVKPADCERLLSISVVDCFGKIHPLGFNSDRNTSSIRCPKIQCSCASCGGEGTLCSAIDAIQATTESVEINGTAYTKTTLTRYNNGAVQRQITTPAWDVATSEVVYNTLVETICNVETTTEGCIKSTPHNAEILRTYCGCGLFLDQWTGMGYRWSSVGKFRELAAPAYNYWGEWNFNAADPNIVHVFGSNPSVFNLHFGNADEEQERRWRSNIRQVIVDYQTNGEAPNTEILIPEYSVQAVQVGMLYQQKLYNPRVNVSEKKEYKGMFKAECMDVLKYLNPIHMEQVMDMQTRERKW